MISDYIVETNEPILVTGSNGFIGVRVVETLLEYGFTNLRCLVRSSSNLENLAAMLSRTPSARKVKLVVGDLLVRDDCNQAVAGVGTIFHLAASFDKSFGGAFMGTVVATRNLIEAFLEHGQPRRFVLVSSFAVYSNRHLKAGSVLDEHCPVEDAPQERYSAYAFSKAKQEELVRQFGRLHKLPFVILRPGAVFGPGNRTLSSRLGSDAFGIYLNVGWSTIVPLTYVDNCAEAIVLAGLKAEVNGETFNIVDDDLPTSSEFLSTYRKRVKGFRVLRVPYRIAYAFSALWEYYSKRSKGQLPPTFNRRRCSAEWKNLRYANAKLRERLGWKPRITMERAMELYLNQFEEPKGK